MIAGTLWYVPGVVMGRPGWVFQFLKLQKRFKTKTSAFSTDAHSRFGSVVPNGVLGPPCIVRHTWLRNNGFSLVLEATHKASQGFDTEMKELLEGTEEISVSALICSQANLWFFLPNPPPYLISCDPPVLVGHLAVDLKNADDVLLTPIFLCLSRTAVIL